MKDNGLNEAWMLHVAIQQGKLSGVFKHNAEYYIGKFLGLGGTWENPDGKALNADEIKAADVILAKINKPKTPKVDLSAIVARFATKKIKVHLTFMQGDLELSAAPMTGKNPGAVYVRVGYEYAGKIVPSGKFWANDKWADGALEGALKAYADTLPKPQDLEVKSPSGFKTISEFKEQYEQPYPATNEQLNVMIHAMENLGDHFKDTGVKAQLTQALIDKIAKGMKGKGEA